MRGIWIAIALVSATSAFAQSTTPSPAHVQHDRPLKATPAPTPRPSLPADADIEALVFLTMATAAREAEEDLRTLLASIQDTNRQRRNARRASKLVAVSENPCSARRVVDWRRCLLNVERKIATLPVSERAALDVEIDGLQSDLDAMNDLEEMNSLRMQMWMNRTSKVMSMLSNIQKKHSDTAQSIIQNIK